MWYDVETFEQEYRKYYYTVEANSKEEAEEKVRYGEAGGCISEKFVEGEIINLKVSLK